ncbi:MAG: HIT family protein [bacterium]
MSDGSTSSPQDCIFCKIVSGELPCHKVWEDERHLAFLSIFPNTDGFTVVTTKKHYGSYFVDQDDRVASELLLVAKKVCQKIDIAFSDVGRTGLIFEGFGVDHLHCKLFPMHGTGDLSEWKPILSEGFKKFFEKYEGYIASNDSKRADDEELAKLAQKIKDANISHHPNL